MSPERWERLEAICLDALEQPESERSAVLAAACDGDPEMLREATSLIERFQPGFLETPVVRLADLPHDTATGAESTIGSYRVVRPLGRGGMGEVYLAVGGGDDFQQAVAIKIVRRGMDSDDVLQRFRLERRILASLNHPNIARMIDGGATPEGTPYFVMEYVDGVPLAEYCDRERLSVDARLRLFQEICQAVQHAHRNMVIHRDLKPANILVTQDGAPKLLDFGIGKVLDSDGSLHAPETRPTGRMLTPEYAAPEQIRGDPGTAATDVYALGVVLYELLTGCHPYVDKQTAPGQVERAVLDRTPPAPSATVSTRAGADTNRASAQRQTTTRRLRRRLAGDLDTIVLKALRKEPERRYTSPGALAEDIGRHLEGRPVRARRDSLRYRVRKFVTRNPWGIAAGAAGLLALGAVSAIPWVSGNRAATERDRALEVQGFLLETFGASGANREVGDAPTARQLLDLQASRFEAEYADRPVLKAQMARVLAEGYERLGVFEEAEAMAELSLGMLRDQSDASDADFAATLNILGFARFRLGQAEQAETDLRNAVRLRRRLGRRHRASLSRSLNDLGVLRESIGDYNEAAALHEEALRIRQAEYGLGHRATAISASNLSVVHYRRGDYERAARVGETALEALRSTVGPDHQRTMVVQSNLAAFRSAMGDLEGARDEYTDLLARQTRLQGRDHPYTIGLIQSLASVQLLLGELDQAEALIREGLAVSEARWGTENPDVASMRRLLGRVLADQGQFDEATRTIRQALEVHQSVYGEAHVEVSEDAAALADVLLAAGDSEGAEETRRLAVRYFERSLGPTHPQTTAQRLRLGRHLVERNKHGEGIAVLLEVVSAADRGAQIPAGVINEARLWMALGFFGLDRLALADSLLALVRAADTAGELGEKNARLLIVADSMRAAR